jgi:hypothetical protein
MVSHRQAQVKQLLKYIEDTYRGHIEDTQSIDSARPAAAILHWNMILGVAQ